MAIVEVDLDALQNLIQGVSVTAEKLSDLNNRALQAYGQFDGTFQSPEKAQLDQEFHDLVNHLGQAAERSQRMHDFLKKVFLDAQSAEHIFLHG